MVICAAFDYQFPCGAGSGFFDGGDGDGSCWWWHDGGDDINEQSWPLVCFIGHTCCLGDDVACVYDDYVFAFIGVFP